MLIPSKFFSDENTSVFFLFCPFLPTYVSIVDVCFTWRNLVKYARTHAQSRAPLFEGSARPKNDSVIFSDKLKIYFRFGISLVF